MEKQGLGNFRTGKFSVAGYPDDLGIRNVNGRTGAAEGPARFWEFFSKLRGKHPVPSALHRHERAKTVPDLERNLEVATSLTRELTRELDPKTDALVVVGGGHDYAYPWVRAAAEALVGKAGPRKKLACLNLDAHFDLRDPFPVMTSGAPFRRLIDEGILDPRLLVEFGIQSHCNAPELWEYAKKKKIQTVPFERLRKGRAVPAFKAALAALSKKSDIVLLSVDLDAMSLAVAPGVSAPQPEGFSAGELYEMLEIAAKNKKVFSLGLFELSPPLDANDATSRLAAQAAWKFLAVKCFKGESRRS
jgi:formiminoglutamase